MSIPEIRTLVAMKWSFQTNFCVDDITFGEQHNLQMVVSRATTGFPVARASWTSSETRKSLSLPLVVAMARILEMRGYSRKEERKFDTPLYKAITGCAFQVVAALN